MANVTEQVKCALCGAEMSADTQYCPKCGSLNAHFTVRKSLGVVEPASPTAAPVSPAAPTPAVQHTTPERHVSRIPVAPEQGYQVAQQDQAATPPQTGWPGPYTDDPDVELSPTWREGMVRVPRRRVGPVGKSGASPDPTTAFLLEMFGLVGFLGLGHMYAGQPARGLLIMVVWWSVYGYTIVSGLITVSLLLVVLVIFGGPALSGYWISNELKRRAQAGPGQDSNRRYLK